MKNQIDAFRDVLSKQFGNFDISTIKYAVDNDLHLESHIIVAAFKAAENMGMSSNVIIGILRIFWEKVENILNDKEYILNEIRLQHPEVLQIKGFREYLDRTINRVYSKLYDIVWEIS